MSLSIGRIPRIEESGRKDVVEGSLKRRESPGFTRDSLDCKAIYNSCVSQRYTPRQTLVYSIVRQHTKISSSYTSPFSPWHPATAPTVAIAVYGENTRTSGE